MVQHLTSVLKCHRFLVLSFVQVACVTGQLNNIVIILLLIFLSIVGVVDYKLYSIFIYIIYKSECLLPLLVTKLIKAGARVKLSTNSIHLTAMEVSTDYELTEESSSTQQINMDIVETVEILDEDVIQGTALLRLYCALKRLAGMKLTQQEAEALLRLVTCHPPPTAAGVRFVVVGLCTLLVCTNIMR